MLLGLGDEAEVMILDIDAERRRISLGIKHYKENPWIVCSKLPSWRSGFRGEI